MATKWLRRNVDQLGTRAIFDDQISCQTESNRRGEEAEVGNEVTFADCRREALHRVTTRIVHEHRVICVETLGVKGMTASAKGTKVRPGTGVKVKSGLNRALLDASMGAVAPARVQGAVVWTGSVAKIGLSR